MNRDNNNKDNNSQTNSINLIENQIEESDSVAGAVSSGEDEVPVGTLREERLVQKLRNIDVLSPNSQQQQQQPLENNYYETEYTVNRGTQNTQNPMQRFQENTHTGLLTTTETPARNYPQTRPRVSSATAMSSKFKEAGQLPTRITLSVNGTRFIVNPCIFTKHPNTMLGRYLHYLLFMYSHVRFCFM